jgi:hypothetical protein
LLFVAVVTETTGCEATVTPATTVAPRGCLQEPLYLQSCCKERVQRCEKRALRVSQGQAAVAVPVSRPSSKVNFWDVGGAGRSRRRPLEYLG